MSENENNPQDKPQTPSFRPSFKASSVESEGPRAPRRRREIPQAKLDEAEELHAPQAEAEPVVSEKKTGIFSFVSEEIWR